MAQSVKIAGALFSNVPSIRVPDENDVFHPFVDPSPTTATAADVASGKIFFAADGTQTSGTASGGSATIVSKTITSNGTYNASADSADGYDPVIVNVSGGGGLFGTLLKTESLGHVATSSGTATDVATVAVNSINSYDILLVVAKAANIRNGYHVCTVSAVFLTGQSELSVKSNVTYTRINYKKTSNQVSSRYSSTASGVFVASASIRNGDITLKIRKAMLSSTTATIDDDYTAYIYGINLYDTVINN